MTPRRLKMDPKDLMRLHVEALFTLDGEGALLAVNEAGGTPAPRFFLGRTAHSNECWFRRDVDPALVDDLRALCLALSTRLAVEADGCAAEPFVNRLAREGAVYRTWAGPAFRFPSNVDDHGLVVRVTADNAAMLSPFLEAWVTDVRAGVPTTVALE